MAQINKPTDYFNTVLWTGNGTSQSITGVNFQPDLVWLKSRSIVESHGLFDIIRGAGERLGSNSTDAETTRTSVQSSFDSDGFSVGGSAQSNQSSATYCAWNWLADNTSGSSNTDGSITSTVSANTTSGFSIVTWTAGSGVGSIGHGLGVEPSMIIVKGRSSAIGWVTGSKSNGWNNYLQLQSTNANNNDQRMFSPSGQSDPTSTVWYQDHSALGSSGDTMVAYVFAEKKGFSKFGSYTGNGSTDGTFVYTGFKPMWVLFKRTDSAFGWYLYDSVRDPENQNTKALTPAESDAEQNESGIDLLSNGFKLRNADGSKNASGGSYIYMAFAESPLVGTNNIPAVAR